MEEGRSTACQAENDGERRVKGLKWRGRIALALALSLIAGGFLYMDSSRSARWMFLAGIMLLAFVLWSRSQLAWLVKQSSFHQADSAVTVVSPKRSSIAGVVVSRGIPVILLIAILPGDPLAIVLPGIMAGMALLMAGLGKPSDARVRLVKAAIYGAAAIAVFAHMEYDMSQVDVVAVKLEEYKSRHYEYPEKLSALVPTLLPEIPKPGASGFYYSRMEDSSSYSLHYKRSINNVCNYSPELKLECHLDLSK